MEKPEVPEELTIKLRKPVSTGEGGDPITELRLREPTAGELKRATAKGSDLEQAIALVAIIAEIAPPFVEAIGARDFKRATEYLANFT